MCELNLEFARNGAAFTIDLFNQILSTEIKDNVIFSPFSIQACLALAYAGAQGETAAEIANVMKYVSNVQTEVAQTFQFVIEKYEDSTLLKIANKSYVQEGKKIKDDYQQALKDYYHAEAEAVNFGDNVNTANTINEWVECKTGGKIKNLIPSDCLSNDTRLVLINALHFKGNWESKFVEERTAEDEFFTSESSFIKIQYMYQKHIFGYGYFPELKCTAIEMRYKDSDLSMFVLLPNEREGLRTLIRSLKSISLIDLGEKMFEEEVAVKFPKFKIDFSLELNETLKYLGLTRIFEDSAYAADFSNMLEPAEDLVVSKVMHKACIEVNEEGTEAAAATAVIVTLRSAPMRVHFNADHPFLYIIWNRKNILFAGTFVDAPSK